MKAQFYGTETDTYYLDSKGRAWLIQSSDRDMSEPELLDGLPADATPISDKLLDIQHWQDSEAIENRIAQEAN